MPHAGYNTFWQLNDYNDINADQIRRMLVDKGFQPKKSSSKADLIRLKRHADCGHLRYDQCSDGELRRFARERNISMIGTRNKRGMISRLEDADEERTFVRFLDLPAELRVRVYFFYVSGFPSVLRTPVLPPLALTCKLIQKEIPPLFFRQATFVLTFLRRTNGPQKESTFRPSAHTQFFLRGLSVDNVAHITKLEVHMRSNWNRSGSAGSSTFCKSVIKLDDSQKGYRLSMDWYKDTDGALEIRRRQMRLKAEFEKVLDEVVGREGKKNLRLDDVYALRKAMEITHAEEME